ncbi:unnamed protein product [Sphagnum jensenii]|uniref:Peptidase A2 domain-containing protein n=1 Tax=Sphagnum jensenii TaxID=128206 RepID=A0ABP1BT13_9BRYO
MEKQVTALNETLVNFFKGVVSNQEASSSSTVIGGCQICNGGDHLAIACPRLNEARPKCAKCGMPRRTENCGVKCNYCSGLGYSEDRCWKKPRDGKSPSGAANFLEVMISDEAATLQQLNKLCGSENIFSHTRVPRRRVPVEVAAGGADPTPQIVGDGIGVDHDAAVRSKILSHFIKGKVSLSPMETILLIPGELEHLESLVKLARRRRDTEVNENQVSMVSAVPTLRRICVNKTHRSKTLHLLVEVNNYIVEGLVDTGASMTVMVAVVVRELGMMHLVTGSETYKTASGVITQTLGRISEVPVKVGGVQCTMTFMVVDTDNYDVLLGLDFLMKIGTIVDVERGLIQSTPTGHNHDWVADKERTIVPKGDAASSSDSDTGTDGSEHGDAVSSPVKQVECEDEFGEDELGQLVKSEGPSEILQLILQEQANDFMNEEITEGDDYAD